MRTSFLALAVTFDDVLTEWVPHRLAAGIGIGVVVLAAALSALVFAKPAAVLYPQEDLRPLIAQWEAEGAPDETVLVYAGGEYAFALYTTIHVDLIDSQTSVQGFRPVINDDRIVVMESHKSEPERHDPLLMVALEQSDSFWFIGSHPGQDLDHIRGQFEQLGYREVDSFTRPGAWLSYWRRS